MIPFNYVLSFGAHQHFDNLIEAEVNTALFAHSKDAREKLLAGQSSIIGGARGKAIVAAATVGHTKVFAEVTQQSHPAALSAFREMNHLAKLGGGDLSLLSVGQLVYEPRVFDGVSCTKEQQTFARQTVPAGAPRLLVIAFDVLG